jgi:hypothetical protein
VEKGLDIILHFDPNKLDFLRDSNQFSVRKMQEKIHNLLHTHDILDKGEQLAESVKETLGSAVNSTRDYAESLFSIGSPLGFFFRFCPNNFPPFPNPIPKLRLSACCWPSPPFCLSNTFTI